MVVYQLVDQPPIIQAIFKNDLENLKILLKENASDANYADNDKRTPLHAAAFKGDIAIVETLILNGANVNAKDSKWITPLHWACCRKHQDVVQILLKNKADPLARDRQYQNSFHIAAANNSSIEIIQLLLKSLQQCTKQIFIQKTAKNPSQTQVQNNSFTNFTHEVNDSGISNTNYDLMRKSTFTSGTAYTYLNSAANDTFGPCLLAFLNITDRGGRTLLHHAAYNGSLEIAEYLLYKGCPINVTDKRDSTPLHWASYSGNDDMVRFLLDYDADPNIQDRDKCTPLHIVCATGNIAVLTELLSKKNNDNIQLTNVNVRNVWGNTPLHTACLHSDCDDVVLKLLNHNAEINARNNRGETALHMTALHGRFTRSKLLIDNGAIIDLQDNNNCTALHIAALHGHELLANTLLNYGADVNMKGFAGRTPLHMCCISGYVECCRKFLQQQVDIDVQDNTGKTPLHCAAFSGSVECLDLLVSSGGNFRIVDNYNRTPLHYSASQGKYNCLYTLVGVGSEVNSRDKDGCTPLHFAAACDLEGRCIQYLLQHKADPYISDYKGYTPIHYSVGSKSGNEIGLGYLLAAVDKEKMLQTEEKKDDYFTMEPQSTPLHLAANYGHSDILKLLFPLFPDVNIRNKYSNSTALHLAACNGHHQCVQLLLRCGALVNVKDSLNRTPIHCAAANGYIDCLTLLLENTEDFSVINGVDCKNRSALILAVANSANECVVKLLKSGADVNIPDEDYNTPLFRAVVSSNQEIVYLLITHGANINHRNLQGKTVFHLSCALGKLQCLLELMKYANIETIKAQDNCDCGVLHWACYNGYSSCLQHLCDKKVFDKLEGNPFSPVHCAAYRGSEQCIDILIEYFGNSIVNLKDHKGRTPLHIACFYNHLKCIELLIRHHSDIEAQDYSGTTPLICAANSGHTQSIELLIEMEANIMACDKSGNTALHFCCIKKHGVTALSIIDKCKQLDKDIKKIVNIANKELKIPLHISARNGLVAVTKHLIKVGSNLMALDQNGLTPALSCAIDLNVARCLFLILGSYPAEHSSVSDQLIKKSDDNQEDILTNEVCEQLHSHNLSVKTDLEINPLIDSLSNLNTACNKESESALTDKT